MIILIGGMPRSGTTFLFNTVKEFFIRKNTTIAIHNIKTSFHMGKFFKNENPDMNINEHINICHYHDYHQVFHNEREIKNIYTIRDPRDTFVSLMKLNNWNFSATLSKVDHAIMNTNHMIDVSNKLFFTYPYLINNRKEAITRVFKYIDIEISEEEINDLYEFSDINQMKKLNEALFKETNAKDFSNQFFLEFYFLILHLFLKRILRQHIHFSAVTRNDLFPFQKIREGSVSKCQTHRLL